MRRIAFIAAAALAVLAQPARDGYRDAYRAWRESGPNLERDAASSGAGFSQRVDRVAALAAKFGSERAAFLKRLASDRAGTLAQIQAPAQPVAQADRGVSENAASEASIVRRNLNTFANDPDAGIQLLKSMLERENLALASLSKAIAERQKAAGAVKSATASVEQAQAKAVGEYRALAGALSSAAGEADRESAAWAAYYGKLAEGARGSSAAPPTAALAPTVITPLPLVRYTGAWTFPSTGGLYHGTQPEFIDLVVHEEDGAADGTMFARFKLPPGSTGDPVLRFDFKGQFRNSRTQVFPLETSDGATGTLELIPGPAFNLLEVNFEIQSKPGKIHQGNAVLIKK